MTEAFLGLSPDDRREALLTAAARSGRPPHLLEKDVWVVWALAVLFGAAFGEHLVFKGGTSLSKAYGTIGRFSEDVDITYDIRALAPGLVGGSPDAIPPNPSQQRRWTREIGASLPRWVGEVVAPLVRAALAGEALDAGARVEADRLFIDYEPVVQGYAYVRPSVMLEFGARSTGEPAGVREVTCDAAAFLPSLSFPTARPRVMDARRTFWEKATAIHVFCSTGTFRGGDRFARHWHDVVRLDAAGHVDAALGDRALATSVARHKGAFFAERDAAGRKVDYVAAVTGAIRLVPEGDELTRLSDDYAAMVADGLLLGEAEPFERLMERCRAIEAKANAPR